MSTIKRLELSILSGLRPTLASLQPPPNINYGQQGDFITKEATYRSRAAIIMPLGPVLIAQPEGPGPSSAHPPNGRDVRNDWFDLTDSTNPVEIP